MKAAEKYTFLYGVKEYSFLLLSEPNKTELIMFIVPLFFSYYDGQKQKSINFLGTVINFLSDINKIKIKRFVELTEHANWSH
jgi:hypothetical protein